MDWLLGLSVEDWIKIIIGEQENEKAQVDMALHIIFALLFRKNTSHSADALSVFWVQLTLKWFKSDNISLVKSAWSSIQQAVKVAHELQTNYPMEYIVSDAGKSPCNGVYVARDVFNSSRVMWVKEKTDDCGEIVFYRCRMRNKYRWWYISQPVPGLESADGDIDYYFHDAGTVEEPQRLPPLSGWKSCPFPRSGAKDWTGALPKISCRGIFFPGGIDESIMFKTMILQLFQSIGDIREQLKACLGCNARSLKIFLNSRINIGITEPDMDELWAAIRDLYTSCADLDLKYKIECACASMCSELSDSQFEMVFNMISRDYFANSEIAINVLSLVGNNPRVGARFVNFVIAANRLDQLREVPAEKLKMFFCMMKSPAVAHQIIFEKARSDSDYPHSFLCPIGMDIMKDPVLCADGHVPTSCWIVK